MTTYTGSRTLPAGPHQVVVEYYEKGGAALAQVSWTPAAPPPPTKCPAGQFLGEYFANMTLAGTPTVKRCDTTIDFSWGAGSPAAGIPADLFSVLWTGRPTFAAGSFVFTARADDGIRVADKVMVIDGWKDQGATTYSVTRTLTAGVHVVKVKYYEKAGDAVASLSWAPG